MEYLQKSAFASQEVKVAAIVSIVLIVVGLEAGVLNKSWEV
jgi:hypothetical protein